MKVKLTGVKSYYEPKADKVYRYHRKTGIPLTATPGTPEFIAQWQAAEAKVAKAPAAKHGSLGLVIDAYRQSNDFATLGRDTRKEYDRYLSLLRRMSELVMNEIASPDVVRIRDNLHKSRNRTAANKCMAVLSILFAFAVERGWADRNPVTGVKKVKAPKGTKYKNRPWSKTELDTIKDRLPARLALPFTIARWTGLRIGDIISLRTELYDGSSIRRYTSKRDVLVSTPVARPLKEALDSRPDAKSEFICLNSRGQPWTLDGFQTSFFKEIRRLEKEDVIGPGLTLHGLRHTVATELRELGFDPRTIADMLGQKSTSMAEHYSRSADLQEKLKPVIKKLENSEKKRTRVSRNPKETV